MPGRGRGEAPDDPSKKIKLRNPKDSDNDSDQQATSSTKSSQQPEQVRGRAGYHSLNTIPPNIKVTRCNPPPNNTRKVQLLTNFIEIKPMVGKIVYQYRFDFEPNIESVLLRRKLVNEHFRVVHFKSKLEFDGMNDGRSSIKLPDKSVEIIVDVQNVGHVTIKVTRVGEVAWGSFEMIRLYNIGMRNFLRLLGFFQLQRGVYVHPEIKTDIKNHDLKIFRGYQTGANLHDESKILMNMDAVHKLMQSKSVLQIMTDMKKNNHGNLAENIKMALINKLIITSYNNRCYRIEDIDFQITPMSTFLRDTTQVTYFDYFKQKYNYVLADKKQPMILVQPNNAMRRRDDHSGGDKLNAIFVPPELCRLAGLTTVQANDMRLRMDLVRSCQLDPRERVAHLERFMQQLHSNTKVREVLNTWGYDYCKAPTTVNAHVFQPEPICWKSTIDKPFSQWKTADPITASFEHHINQRERIAVAPNFKSMYIIIPDNEKANMNAINTAIKEGFDSVGLGVQNVRVKDMRDDRPATIRNTLKDIPNDADLILIILQRQNKEKYDVIKKFSTCDRGIPTQVVTSRLILDQRKQRGAAVKIAIQIAAKVGGEPWLICLPLQNTMVCGYDTYHDTVSRGRSYGAFIASTNARFSKWFCKVNRHSGLEEMTSNLTCDLGDALKYYKEKNGRNPEKVIFFRDGIGDGQLEHAFKVEVKQARKAMSKISQDIKLTFIIVNKRIGARFYQKTGAGYSNPIPGTCIDNTVTRANRYDFFLISQSTRQGTVTPTYYNILFDESGLTLDKLQMLAYKMTLNYYNWAGGVRVPAPCQYAHKLAFQTGENLHTLPNPKLTNSLHFL